MSFIILGCGRLANSVAAAAVTVLEERVNVYVAWFEELGHDIVMKLAGYGARRDWIEAN